MITARQIVVRYGARRLFDDFSCAFSPGCHAIVGANGVGKSTLLRLLAGIEPPLRGEIEVYGISLAGQPVEARRRLFYVPDRPVFYDHMSGRDFVDAVLRFRGLARDALGELADRFDIEALLPVLMRDMSLGMQRRLFMALAFVGDGAILLDEPSNGLDEGYRGALLDLLRARSNRDTIVFSSHDDDFIAAANATRWRLADGRLTPV